MTPSWTKIRLFFYPWGGAPFNPFKIGPSGEPIKNGSSADPARPLEKTCNSRRRFFCFSSTQDNDKKQPNIPVKPPCNGESENAFKNSVGQLWRKLRQKKCARLKLFGRRLFASLQYRARQWGGREGGGGKTARSEFDLCLSKYVWGKLGFILKSVKILSKTLLTVILAS